jgi:tight adherence protein C
MTATALVAGIAAALGVAGVAGVAGLAGPARPGNARRADDPAGTARPATPRRGGGRRLSRLVAALARAGRGLSPRAPGDLAGRIAAAGVAVSVGDVMAVKAGAAVAGSLAALPLATAAPGRLGPLGLAAAAAAGFLAPDAWLRRRTRARTRAMEAELADVLDLMRVATAAGLAPRRALAEVGRRHPGVLAAELRRASARLALGTPGEAVLAGLEHRCRAHGIAALTAALRRADVHGAPLGPSLAAQAAQARSLQAQRAARAAARAAPKIQLVVALLLVPAVLLLVAAALLPALGGAAT